LWTYDVNQLPLEINNFFGRSRLRIEVMYAGQLVLQFARPRVGLLLRFVTLQFLLVLLMALLLCKYA
jgi:hypothetical protein